MMRKFVIRNLHIEEYKPIKLTAPARQLQTDSAWKGLEQIIEDILDRYHVGRSRCIEFGVEFGYSAVVFSNFFSEVTGVDTFAGDDHTINKTDHYEATKQRLATYPNIRLVRSDYKNFIRHDHGRFDFAHVDIIHNFKETHECGLWAARHADVAIFHDTESFAGVRLAVVQIAKKTGGRLFNYPRHSGLGIIISKRLLQQA
jgi:hypothetical protein